MKKVKINGTEFVFEKSTLEDEVMGYWFIIKDQLVRYVKVGKKNEDVKKIIRHNMSLIRKHLKKKGL